MTSRILLAVEDATLPTSNPAGGPTKITSSGGAVANGPVVTYQILTFNDTTDQHAMWAFRLPDDYLSGGTVTILWGHAANTGNVIWKAGAELIVPAGVVVSASSYNAADVAAAVAVPATIGQEKETSIALTMTGALAGAWCSVFVGRDADAGGDTATGNANLLAVQFSYTS